MGIVMRLKIGKDSSIHYKGESYSDPDLVGHEGQTVVVEKLRNHIAVYIERGSSVPPILYCVAKKGGSS